MRIFPLVLTIAVGAVALSSSTAEAAANCAKLDFPGSGAQEVIIGEYATVVHPFSGDILLRSGKIGVCWRDAGGAWTLEQPTATQWVGGSSQTTTCDISTSGADTLLLTTGAGDDTVTTLLEEHTYTVGGADWLEADDGPAGTTHAMYCGSDDFAIAPWNPTFDFGVAAILGTGLDRFFGTPNDDLAHSNHVYTVNPPGPLTSVQQAPGDNASDVLCGGRGDDELLGDADDSWSAEEVLDGGYGDDFCDGDPHDWPNTAGGSSYDVARHVAAGDYGCDTIERATTPAIWSGGWSMVAECWAFDNPVDYFGL
ncbi:MAG: hypothetical protein KUG77_20075 [Nannocystaceae bacterium]|nr:hypothetical protein [Nannocystaceae bacterium]